MQKKKSIAIIGSGISGLSAAYFLSDNYDVKLYEKNNYLGGHTNTATINYNQNQINVDTGFIVFNKQTYPNLIKFFELLEVEYEKSNMSFGIKIDNGDLEYAGTNLKSVFAQIKNLFNPKFLLMLYEIIKFNNNAIKILEKDFNPNYSLGDFLNNFRFSKYFKEYYLLPMSGAIWSCPIETMLSYPAQSFVRFFKNHGLLTVSNQPQWYFVKNGSAEYVKKIIKKIGNNFILNEEVFEVMRDTHKVTVKSKNSTEEFDMVFFACHADQILSILNNPTNDEFNIFSSFQYQKNIAVLHCDESVMPINKRAWASWIYSKNTKYSDNTNSISVNYWMNNLQNIDNNFPIFVSLNSNQKINKDKIFASFEYEHPIFNSQAIKAQSKIDQIQGINNTYYCGAYQKYGFHEDGITSTLSAINKLNVCAPWQS